MESKKAIICWWSGGVTSAVAIWLAIQIYGKDRIRIIFIDTFNEHHDTYRFKIDCENWYEIKIETITAIGGEYKKIQDVWFKYLSLNVATGAVCSSELKRRVREKWQEENPKYTHQVFGFDISETKRAISLSENHPKTKAIYPLLMFAFSKKKCIEELQYNFISIPVMYWLGFLNNNCFGTGCVQGGIGYWQKMFKDFRFKFLRMAIIEHQLTNLLGRPVTMLKDQSKEAKKSGNELVFLIKHPNYPELKCLADFKQQEVKPLFECNGFCGTNDLSPRTKTEQEINYDNQSV